MPNDLPKTGKLSHIVILKYRWIFLLAVNLFTITVIHLNQSICSPVFEQFTLIWRECKGVTAEIPAHRTACFLPCCSKTSLSGRAQKCFTPPFIAGAVLQNSSSGQYLARVVRQSLNFTALWAKTVWLTGDSILQKGCHNAFCSFLLGIYCLPQWFLS